MPAHVLRPVASLSLAALMILSPVTAARASETIKDAGTAVTAALPLIAGGVSLLNGDEEGAVQLVKSVVVSSGLAFGLSRAFKSRNPDGTVNDTFPSNHATVAFGAASYMDHRYGWKYGLPSYLAAGFVGYSRIEADKHNLVDIVGAAVLSWGVSHLFVTPLPVDAGAEVTPDRALLRISARW
jgi:membrane-associated phospholipid phosphatase